MEGSGKVVDGEKVVSERMWGESEKVVGVGMMCEG